MSELIHSWLDKEELQRLSAVVAAPDSQRTHEVAEANFGPSYRTILAGPSIGEEVATAASEALHQTHQSESASIKNHSSSEPQMQAPVLKNPEQSPVRNSSVVQQPHLKRPPAPSGEHPLLERVKEFGVWLKDEAGVKGFFISNLEGRMMVDFVRNKRVIEVALSLVNAARQARENSGTAGLRVKLGEESVLQIIPAPSQYGVLILGLIVKDVLADQAVLEIRQALTEVANARLINP